MSEILESEARTGFSEIRFNRRGAIKLGFAGIAFAIGAGMDIAEQHSAPQDCQSFQHDEAFNSPFGSSPDNPANKAYQEDVCPAATPALEDTPTPDLLVQR